MDKINKIDKSKKLKTQFLLFIFGCIGSRLAFTIISSYSTGIFLKLLGLIALGPIIGWLYIFFIEKRDTGFEVFGDKIWWKDLRPLHTLLWATFSYMAITGNRNAWIILLIDTLFGLSAFLVYHWRQGDFKKVLLE
jgi:hypothetical protein